MPRTKSNPCSVKACDKEHHVNPWHRDKDGRMFTVIRLFDNRQIPRYLFEEFGKTVVDALKQLTPS